MPRSCCRLKLLQATWPKDDGRQTDVIIIPGRLGATACACFHWQLRPAGVSEVLFLAVAFSFWEGGVTNPSHQFALSYVVFGRGWGPAKPSGAAALFAGRSLRHEPYPSAAGLCRVGIRSCLASKYGVRLWRDQVYECFGGKYHFKAT